jgi:hypothetical protein
MESVDTNDEAAINKHLHDRAYPIVLPKDKEHHIAKGLSKRELFASQAMQSMLNRPEVTQVLSAFTEDKFFKFIADKAVRAADALMAELDKK